jgi:simple sugar transport system permease protein
MVVALWWVLKATRVGLVIRAVGESHEAAHALGYKVNRIRLGCIAFGGAMAGMGGAYISLARVPQWVDGITNGQGWIALAIVVFAAWRPGFVLIGAYLFGGITALQLRLQVTGSSIPVEYLSMAPYLVTILVLVVLSAGRNGRRTGAPACLGQNFHASR